MTGGTGCGTCVFAAWAREAIEIAWAVGVVTNWGPAFVEPTWAGKSGGTCRSVRLLGEAFVLSNTSRFLAGRTSAKVLRRLAHRIGSRAAQLHDHLC